MDFSGLLIAVQFNRRLVLDILDMPVSHSVSNVSETLLPFNFVLITS